jgi:hypothetical protein
MFSELLFPQTRYLLRMRPVSSTVSWTRWRTVTSLMSLAISENTEIWGKDLAQTFTLLGLTRADGVAE